MRRVLPLIVAVAALLPAAAAHASGAAVIRDCTLDGKLDKSYSQKELRQALASIPSDVDEYTDCRDVIRAAQLAAATGGGSNGGSGTSGGAATGSTGGGAGGSGGTNGGSTAGGTSGDSGTDSATPAGVFGGFPGGAPAHSATPDERAAIADARQAIADQDPVAEAGVGLPTPLIGALAVGALALAIFAALDIRRRLVDRRSA